MDLDSIRRFWAEYYWRKLDLKKTARLKNPVTEDDLVEPRTTWRIAHLKSLGIRWRLATKRIAAIHPCAPIRLSESLPNNIERRQNMSQDNPNYPSTTGNEFGGGRGNTKK